MHLHTCGCCTTAVKKLATRQSHTLLAKWLLACLCCSWWSSLPSSLCALWTSLSWSVGWAAAKVGYHLPAQLARSKG